MIRQTIYFGRPVKISIKNKQIKITEQSDEPKEQIIPIEDIGFVVLDHPQITITQGAIVHLMNQNAVIISCNEKYMPHALMLPFEGNDVMQMRVHLQVNASEPLKKNLWMQTVRAKIYNQANLLDSLGITNHPLHKIRKQVKSGDTTNCEGHASAYYWKLLFVNIKSFSRDPAGMYPNNFLNYGYAVLRSIVARAIVSAGLFPYFGIYHHNKYNAFCLADDLMEPYRPFVDWIVLGIMKKFPDQAEIVKNVKAELLQIPYMDVQLENDTTTLLRAAHRTAVSLVHVLEGKKRKILYPTFYAPSTN